MLLLFCLVVFFCAEEEFLHSGFGNCAYFSRRNCLSASGKVWRPIAILRSLANGRLARSFFRLKFGRLFFWLNILILRFCTPFHAHQTLYTICDIDDEWSIVFHFNRLFSFECDEWIWWIYDGSVQHTHRMLTRV